MAIQTCYRTSDGAYFNTREIAERHEEAIAEREYEVEIYVSGTYCAHVRAKSKKEAYLIARDMMDGDYISGDITGYEVDRV